jgi:hypothetical protein
VPRRAHESMTDLDIVDRSHRATERHFWTGRCQD